MGPTEVFGDSFGEDNFLAGVDATHCTSRVDRDDTTHFTHSEQTHDGFLKNNHTFSPGAVRFLSPKKALGRGRGELCATPFSALTTSQGSRE